MKLYCIEHENMFEAKDGICGLGHIDLFSISYDLNEAPTTEYDLDFCCFPPDGEGWATCPPPEAPDIELIAAFDRPYTVDLLEYHAQTMQEEAELLVEMITQEVYD